VQNALESVRDELDRRRRDEINGDADLVLVVRELADLDADALVGLSAIAADGPDYGVRLLVASAPWPSCSKPCCASRARTSAVPKAPCFRR
jgi:hypothetical protein